LLFLQPQFLLLVQNDPISQKLPQGPTPPLAIIAVEKQIFPFVFPAVEMYGKLGSEHFVPSEPHPGILT
jgi:hypothetical protein